MVPMTMAVATIMASTSVRAVAPASAAAMSSVMALKELSPQLPANLFQMHEIAIPPTVAHILLVLTASSFSEISNRRVLHNNRTSCVESSMQIIQSLSSMFFLTELDIYIANHVISKIVTDIKRLYIAIFA